MRKTNNTSSSLNALIAPIQHQHVYTQSFSSTYRCFSSIKPYSFQVTLLASQIKRSIHILNLSYAPMPYVNMDSYRKAFKRLLVRPEGKDNSLVMSTAPMKDCH